MNSPRVLSISEINYGIKTCLEGQFSLIWVRGEISNFKAHSSGHHYFSLKDAKSQINAVMFKGHNRNLRFAPKDGVEVLVRGRVSVYEPRGNYQIFCETMEPVGAGALQKAFEELKLKLKEEGLFSEERKKPIPALPKHVALVTSPTGAAVKDMLNVIGRRFKGLKIIVVPCRVQGKEAPGEIIAALKNVEEYNLKAEFPIDVVICGRGGGSAEDLWAFNKENLARAISNFSLPIISAVGHEVDFTIADFVADLRAPTPSAAAELVVKNAQDLDEKVLGLKRRLLRQVSQHIRFTRQKIQGFDKRLVDPKRRLQDLSLRCDDLLQRLETAVFHYFESCRVRVKFAGQRMVHPKQKLQKENDRLHVLKNSLAQLIRHKIEAQRQNLNYRKEILDSLSPLKVVDRGYALVTTGKKKTVIKSVEQLKVGTEVSIRLARGEAVAEIKKVNIK